MLNRGPIISFKPAAWYWRAEIRELRADGDVEALADVAGALVDDTVQLRAFIRANGLIPPKGPVSAREGMAKPQLRG